MDGDISVVSYWEKPSPLLPAVAAFCWVKSRRPRVFLATSRMKEGRQRGGPLLRLLRVKLRLLGLHPFH